MLNIKDIVEGYLHKNLNKLGLANEKKKKLAKDRMTICVQCVLFNNGYCNPEGKIENIKTKEIVEGCGCNLSAKVFCKECSCPANKW